MATLTRSNAAATRANNAAVNAALLSIADLEDASNPFDAPAPTPAPVIEQPKPKPSLLTNTSLRYLASALDKVTEPMHPNFARALKPDQLRMHQTIRITAARAYDANKGAVRATIVAIGKALKGDVQAYVTFYKGLASDAAFAAHMDCRLLQKSVSSEAMDEGLDAMGEEHPIDSADIGAFDNAEATRAAPREDYAGDQPEPIATSIEDAYEAIEGVQAWIGLAVSGFKPDQLDYWQVAGLFPFGQKGKADGYAPIRDFDAYREHQDAQYKLKRNTVAIDPDVEDAMLSA